MPIVGEGDFLHLGPCVDSRVESWLASSGCASTTSLFLGLVVPKPMKIKPVPVASAPIRCRFDLIRLRQRAFCVVMVWGSSGQGLAD